MGVPEIGCNCEVCLSDNPKNKRFRSSILVKVDGFNILIDTSPDFRTQMLNNDIKRVDAVLFTHHHSDHVMGLDDIKRFNHIQDTDIPIYGTIETIKQIKKKFSYIFDENHPYKMFLPRLNPVVIDGKFRINNLCIDTIEVYHAKMPVLGYRINNFAYVTDCNEIRDDSLKKLQGLDTLVLGTLRTYKHISHFSIAEGIEIANILKPKKTYFTHFSHAVDHGKIEKELPENIYLAFDGLEIEI